MIHLVFIVSAVALAWIDKILHTYMTPKNPDVPGLPG